MSHSPRTESAPTQALPVNPRVITVYALCLVLAGCGGSSLNRGANYYSEGHYIDAAQLFEHTESELASYDAGQRARYGLYRGATLLHLGDMAEAERWLAYGARIAARNPHALTSSESAALSDALSQAKARQALEQSPTPLGAVGEPPAALAPTASSPSPAGF
jgi:hypothetical protein